LEHNQLIYYCMMFLFFIKQLKIWCSCVSI